MSKINILHLVNAFGDDSLSRIILRLISNIGIENVQWHVGGLNYQAEVKGEIKDDFSLCGAQVVDFSGNGINGTNRQIKELRDYITSNKIQIIHTHTPRTIFSATLALFGLRDITHLATKHLLTSPSDRKWGPLIALMDRLSLYFPDHLMPVSKKMYQQIIKQPRVKKNRVTMVRNAIPFQQFHAPDQRDICRAELGLFSTSIVLGYTGRIQKVKRLDLLLGAFAQISKVYPDTRLLIAGEGEARSQLESYAESSGISSKIIWTGFRKDIHRILSAMDIYVQTSSNEGLSLSILEAMAAGKPVIATDVGGNSEVIENGVSGILVENSVDKIAEAISRLLDSPELRNNLSSAALELIQRDFSLDSMINNYRKVYEAVIAEI